MQSRTELLDDRISNILAKYKNCVLSCSNKAQNAALLDTTIKKDVEQIHDMFCMDLEALSTRYTSAMKEVQQRLFMTKKDNQKNTNDFSNRMAAVLSTHDPDAVRPAVYDLLSVPDSSSLPKTCALLSILGRPELSKTITSFQKGNPIHMLSLEDAAALDNCELLEVHFHEIKRDAENKILKNHDDACAKSGNLTPLMRAAETNALQAAEFLLTYGANPNAMVMFSDRHGPYHNHNVFMSSSSALDVAYTNNHIDMMELLISHGAKSNISPDMKLYPCNITVHSEHSCCLLHKAWKTGGNMTMRKFRLVLEAMREPGGTSVCARGEGIDLLLFRSCSRGDLHTCRAVISKISPNNPDLRECLYNAIASGCNHLTKILLDHGVLLDHSAIRLAIVQGQEQILSLLLLNGGGYNNAIVYMNWQEVYKPVIVQEHTHMLKALLHRKFSFHKILQERREREHKETFLFAGTPLMIAASAGKHDAIKALLASTLYQNKEHVNERAGSIAVAAHRVPRTSPYQYSCYPQSSLRSWKNGDTPLFLAAASGNSEAINAILQAGGDPNMTNDQGDKPIHRLVRTFREELLEGLFSSATSKKVSVGVGQRFAAGLSTLLRSDPSLVDAQDSNERTPLKILATSLQSPGLGNYNMPKKEAHYSLAVEPLITVLLESGADLFAVDDDIPGESINSLRLKKAYLKTICRFMKSKEDESKLRRAERNDGGENKKKKKKNIKTKTRSTTGGKRKKKKTMSCWETAEDEAWMP